MVVYRKNLSIDLYLAGGHKEMSSWLTNSALVYEPKCGGRGWSCGVSADEYSCTTEIDTLE
jgi:hypothetical protein